MKHQVIIQPKGLSFEADEDETILDAASKAGIKMLKSCDNGICEVCRATLKTGQIDTPQGQMDETHEEVNPILPCVSKARSNLILEQKRVLAPGEIPVQHIAFQIKDINPMLGGVYEVNLLAPAGKLPEFHAGQYLELLIEDKEYPFTIASAPGTRELQLHLGTNPKNPSTLEILSYLENNVTVRIRLAKGNVWMCAETEPYNLHDPLVFVVAGTGFAQAKSMIEEQFKHQHSALHVYWINRNNDGFYTQLAEEWAEKGLVHYHALAPDNTGSQYYSNKKVQQLMADDFGEDLSHVRVVCCGSPNFVYKVLDGLEAKGMSEKQMMSDVFAYAPRPKK